jgi:hypothetical protein
MQLRLHYMHATLVAFTMTGLVFPAASSSMDAAAPGSSHDAVPPAEHVIAIPDGSMFVRQLDPFIEGLAYAVKKPDDKQICYAGYTYSRPLTGAIGNNSKQPVRSMIVPRIAVALMNVEEDEHKMRQVPLSELVDLAGVETSGTQPFLHIDGNDISMRQYTGAPVITSQVSLALYGYHTMPRERFPKRWVLISGASSQEEHEALEKAAVQTPWDPARFAANLLKLQSTTAVVFDLSEYLLSGFFAMRMCRLPIALDQNGNAIYGYVHAPPVSRQGSRQGEIVHDAPRAFVPGFKLPFADFQGCKQQ